MQHDPSLQLESVQFSAFFNALTDTPYRKPMTVQRLIEAIRSNEIAKEKTQILQSKSGLEAKEYAAQALIYVTLSGTYLSSKRPECLQVHSGLIALHLCELTKERLAALRKALQADESVRMLFADMLGTGLIVVFMAQCTNAEEHQALTHQLADYLRDGYSVSTLRTGVDKPELDTASMAVDWAFPVSHDPGVYYQPNSDIWVLLPSNKPQAEPIILNDDEPIIQASTPTAFSNLTEDLRTEREQAQERINEGPNETTDEPETEGIWPRPLPILTSLRPVLPMEPDMIPEPIRPWLADTAHRIKCPLDFVASTAIVMLSALIGTRLTLHTKTRDDWNVVPNLWGAVIGGPSAMKTPSINAVLKPLTRLVLAARAEYEEQLALYEQAMVEYESQRKAHAAQALDRHKGKKIDNPVSYPEEPKKPKERRYMVNDTTIEKLADLMIENPTGLLHIRDELTGLLASWEKAGHEQDRAFHLEAWSGNGFMVIDRIGRGSTYAKLICESLFGGIQPSKLLPYLQAATGYENDGFVQRLQVAVYPDPAPWNYEDEYPDQCARDKAFMLIKAIADSDFKSISYDADEYNRLPYTRFDADAQQVFKDWLIELQTQILPNESGLLEEHFNKYRSLMPSLALIFHIVNVIDTPAPAGQKQLVSADAAAMAVRWCAYLMSHARRIYGLLDTAPLEAAKDLVRHIRQGDLTDGFKTRDIQRQRWKGLTSSEQIDAALSELLTRYYVREVRPVHATGGGRPEAISYVINPRIQQDT